MSGVGWTYYIREMVCQERDKGALMFALLKENNIMNEIISLSY